MAEFRLTVQVRGALALPTEIRRRHRLDEPGAQVRLVEREAEADVAAGLLVVTDGPDEFLEELESTA
jgi:bifunctional DNA-binding transcriptional regulator/antitoxin component of YhaV-PrlF toxin-antitoxin module